VLWSLLGGKIVVFEGDFRQVLPVVRRGRGIKLSMLHYRDRTYGVPCDS
jgi:hypothetical protein